MTKGRLYETVADAIAAEIASGAYALNDRLPSERHLADAYAVSRPTVREALIALEIDGIVEVAPGAGVFVRALKPRGARPAPKDVGLFEWLEARAVLEGEVAALAAKEVSTEEIAALAALVQEMERENARDVRLSEDADRRFHATIAEATGNSALVHAVEQMWSLRSHSLQAARILEKARAEGVKPLIADHAAILAALEARDPDRARAAMRDHLSRVADLVFAATESEALEQARAGAMEERKKFRLAADA